MSLMEEQFQGLINSGLFGACSTLYIGIIDTPNKNPKNGIAWIRDFWEFAIKKVEIIVYPQNKEEADTMKWIKNYAKDNADDYVLYLHTKGVTRNTTATTDWRRYMEYFAVENWQECITKLDEGYDCCGVMWNTDTPIGMHPHFSGTIWWANTNYINTLDHGFLDSTWKFHREFWIGSNPEAKPFEFHNSRLNDKESLLARKGHYDVTYPRSNYAKNDESNTIEPMANNTIHIICTVFNRATNLNLFISSFILQTNPNWQLYIINDGPPIPDIDIVIASYRDPRVHFISTPIRNGHWGHPNRQLMLKQMPLNHRDFVLITNDDNYYVPIFVEYFLKECRKPDMGFVYCNTLHSFFQYDILTSEIREGAIDMGSFAVRIDVAKRVGFNHIHISADGAYAVECANYCRVRRLRLTHISKCLFIHN